MNRNLPDGFDIGLFSSHFGDDEPEDDSEDLPTIETCMSCSGDGVSEDGGELSPCPDCNGRGTY